MIEKNVGGDQREVSVLLGSVGFTRDTFAQTYHARSWNQTFIYRSNGGNGTWTEIITGDPSPHLFMEVFRNSEYVQLEPVDAGLIAVRLHPTYWEGFTTLGGDGVTQTWRTFPDWTGFWE